MIKYEKEYLSILKEELIPAMGCTEPIALAYAAAVARKILGKEPEHILASCSGNMIKNVRCVTIPNSGGMTGIETACVLGAIAGDPDAKMEVLESVKEADRVHGKKLLAEKICEVEYLDSDIPLHFIIEVFAGEDKVSVEVQNTHTNIVLVKKNEKILFEKNSEQDKKEKNPGEREKIEAAGEAEGELSTDRYKESEHADRSCLSLEEIKNFADQISIEKIRPFCENQIRCNMDIAYEGISGNYGLGIGRVIRESYADGLVTRMKAYAAAASEARMDGCDMPVIINSGSGNQGIASSVPIIVYAREQNIPSEKLYRALIFSSLLTIYQKEFIGKLSAFCGGVSASCASGAAITYISGGSLKQIKATIDNTLANIPGIICDGAKISCAAKIASCLDAAMMAHYLAMKDKEYEAYTGILKEDAGETISCVGYIGKVGMHETDKEIIKMMLN
jgi:L-cysteine desulfidase